jgi:hypothetical protein
LVGQFGVSQFVAGPERFGVGIGRSTMIRHPSMKYICG